MNDDYERILKESVVVYLKEKFLSIPIDEEKAQYDSNTQSGNRAGIRYNNLQNRATPKPN